MPISVKLRIIVVKYIRKGKKQRIGVKKKSNENPLQRIVEVIKIILKDIVNLNNREGSASSLGCRIFFYLNENISPN